MQLTIDTHDRLTLYADLRDDEALTDDLRVRAITRARKLGAQHVEFWRPPYGCGGDCMAGFVETAHVQAAPKRRDDMDELPCARPSDLALGWRR